MPELGSPGRNRRGEDIPAAARSPARAQASRCGDARQGRPVCPQAGRRASLVPQGVTGKHREFPARPHQLGGGCCVSSLHVGPSEPLQAPGNARRGT